MHGGMPAGTSLAMPTVANRFALQTCCRTARCANQDSDCCCSCCSYSAPVTASTESSTPPARGPTCWPMDPPSRMVGRLPSVALAKLFSGVGAFPEVLDTTPLCRSAPFTYGTSVIISMFSMKRRWYCLGSIALRPSPFLRSNRTFVNRSSSLDLQTDL